MARMNQNQPNTGRPSEPKPDTHTPAKAAAYESGLAAWAMANGFVCPDGSPAIHTAKQRRTVERAKAKAEGQA